MREMLEEGGRGTGATTLRLFTLNQFDQRMCNQTNTFRILGEKLNWKIVLKRQGTRVDCELEISMQS